jgi:hypothetical protein
MPGRACISSVLACGGTGLLHGKRGEGSCWGQVLRELGWFEPLFLHQCTAIAGMVVQRPSVRSVLMCSDNMAGKCHLRIEVSSGLVRAGVMVVSQNMSGGVPKQAYWI